MRTMTDDDDPFTPLAGVPAVVDSAEPEVPSAYLAEDIRLAAERDMDFFGGLVLPDDCTQPFPAFYLWLWCELIDRLGLEKDFTKYAIGLPRGHGKTAVIKLLIVYIALYKKKRYILIVAATAGKAEAILSDVRAMLCSANVVTVFGNWEYQKVQDRQDKLIFSMGGRKIVIEAAGAGTAIRGANQGNARPDVIIFDDAQTKECAESIPKAKAFRSWFYGTAMKAKAPDGCTFIYIGNMYKDLELIEGSGRYTCVLRNLQRSRHWKSIIVGAITADGQALWEAVQPLSQLLEEYESDVEAGEADIFFAEVMNSPTGASSYHFDPSKMKIHRPIFPVPHQGNFIVCDPSTSKDTPDKFVLMYCEMHEARPVVCDIKAEKLSSPHAVAQILHWASSKQCPLIVIEDNAYQFSILEWIAFICEQQGIHGITAVGLHNGKNKNGRILRSFQAWMKGEIAVVPEMQSTIQHQAVSFDPRNPNNVDDIVDAAEMCTRVPLKFRHLFVIPGELSDTPVVHSSEHYVLGQDIPYSAGHSTGIVPSF